MSSPGDDFAAQFQPLLLAPMNRSGLSQLTIVIPTYQRPDFVLRQFAYWAGSDVHVVILDGSSTPLTIPENLRSENVLYVHTATSFRERLASVGHYVSTPYCAMLSDDEFFTFSGLRSAIARLESDPTVLGCVGRCLYFFVDQGRFLLKDAYREWKSFSDAAKTPQQRLDEDLPPHKTHMAHYSIMRSEAWVRILENSYRRQFSSAYVYERLVNLQRAMLGRTVILEDLLWFRSMENRNIATAVSNSPGFLAWALDPIFSEEVAEYRAVARRLLMEGGIPNDEAIRFEERFFVDGVQQTLVRKSKLRKRFRDKFRQQLLVWSPKRFRLFVKRHLPSQVLSFSGWQGYDLETMCDSLRERGTRFERNEIDLVKELALRTASDVATRRR